MGINRNIVECKYTIRRGVKRWQTVLIETLWNVNLFRWHIGKNLTVVLIETLWNVNNGESLDVFTPADVVLIETLWNVNSIFWTSVIGVPLCINRNIVECKSTFLLTCDRIYSY